MSLFRPGLFVPFFSICVLAAPSQAETGYEGWLRYAAIDDASVRKSDEKALPAVVVILGNSVVEQSAQAELVRGVRGLLNRTERIETVLPPENAILLGTIGEVKKAVPTFNAPTDLVTDGFYLKTISVDGRRLLVVTALNDRGVLYGTFALLRTMALYESIVRLDDEENPYAPIRVINQWDNLDGTIERGYAGGSIFWANGHIVSDLTRVGDYARLLASLGLDGCSINNVNADPHAIDNEHIRELARAAAVFRPWGVKLFVCINFGSPKSIGGLDTFDPLDPRVIDFWNKKVEEIYAAIPDFGGFIMKADSEGELGPSAYGRTHADAANVVARPLKAHSGIVFYRGFVYNHHADWRNLKLDRAKAAYNNFHHLDGQFANNAIVQIKNGPIDFQVREPASPLFGGLDKTAMALEVQITQEYLGQQRHLCFEVPMWKETLDFDLHAKGAGTPVKALAAGKVFHNPLGGFAGVANVGLDTNWLAHPLAMANLYGFGRLAWDPDLSSQQIAEEWTEQTFSHDPQVVKAICDMQLKSWRTYEDYTGPLGVGGLTDIIEVHYGPGIESAERNGWGQWIRADRHGIGMDRTVATGTGYTAQYHPPVSDRYESLKTCPDELVLFFHHLPYNYVLHSGKTLIQHIYDTHYAGVEQVKEFVREWQSLQGKVDEQRYNQTLALLEYQVGHATEWRDAVCQWFFKISGIPDQYGRVDHDPNRIEAEAMKLDGYEVFDVKPWETASGGKAIRVVSADNHGSAGFNYSGKPGWYNLAVQYYDQTNGVSQFTLLVAGQQVDHWLADDILPSRNVQSLPNGHTSTRHTTHGVALRTGDEIKIEAVADGGERACVDYLEIEPARP
ncbi:MAG TPA: alpha-glucuronidase family glycosyl hydrolase [Candidatus Sulfopaludibacter sp.]|nr:alpha-glucuronidase family glycosyl hydrolase [Candidatus Sulfopaludibacter sp.]